MTATITKRADELKPGDVLPIKDGRIVVIGLRYISGDEVEIVACVPTSNYLGVETRTQREFLNMRIEVESPALSPAQQHAEELLELIRECEISEDTMMTDWERRAVMLLAKIDPPKPPTLEESLELLGKVQNGSHRIDKVDEFLDRARRSGVLKP